MNLYNQKLIYIQNARKELNKLIETCTDEEKLHKLYVAQLILGEDEEAILNDLGVDII